MTAALHPFHPKNTPNPTPNWANTQDGDFKGKCIGAVFNDNNVATGEIKFIDCDGTDGQMWQPISGGVQWRNKATLTCMTSMLDVKARVLFAANDFDMLCRP
jgi:hypothetical protein